MGIVHENTNFHGIETLRRRKTVHWEKKSGVTEKQQKTGSTDFSSALNPCETLESAFTHGCCMFWSFNCEHGHCCYSCRQALGLNAVIPTCCYAMFCLRKSKRSESFENERFTLSVAWVVNCGEKFGNCGCSNKWEWISVNEFVMLQLLILIAYVAGPNLQFRYDRRGMCAELDGACGGHQSFQVVKIGGLHLVVTEVIPVGGDENEKVLFISIKLTSG